MLTAASPGGREEALMAPVFVLVVSFLILRSIYDAT
jgi:hypothetical protein